MPRRAAKDLTELGIKRLAKAAPGQRREISDTAPGLVLRVTDQGSKSFAVYYRWPDPIDGRPKQTRLTFGDWPTIDLETARGKARRVRSWVKQGLDPKLQFAAEVASERAEADKANRSLRTFKDLAESYIKRECPRLALGKSYAGTIRRELIAAWGHRSASDLRRRDLTGVTDGIVDSGRPAVAFRVHEIAKRVYSWALDRGEVEAHPFAGMRPPVKKQPRRRVLTDDEIKALWVAWDSQNYPFGRLQQLLLLTGQRRSEVAGMRWSEINLEAATWVIPADRSKSKREHLVPLGSMATAILEAMPTWNEGDHVFSTRGGRTPVSGFGKAKSLVDGASGVKDWRLHDLRRTCRTRLAALSVTEIVAERVLSHVPKGLSAVYNLHDYEAEKAEALQAWDNALQLIIDPPANVVTLGAMRRPGAA